MKRIVLGYDDTESAKRALKRTCELAKLLEGYVVVVSVAPVLVGAGRGIGPDRPNGSTRATSRGTAPRKGRPR